MENRAAQRVADEGWSLDDWGPFVWLHSPPIALGQVASKRSTDGNWYVFLPTSVSDFLVLADFSGPYTYAQIKAAWDPDWNF